MSPEGLPRPLTPTAIAWVAGIYEGEGSCRPGLTDKNGVSLSVTQKDPWLTQRLRATFGGAVGLATSEIRGKRFTATVWRLHGAGARGLLMTIYALLSPRRMRQVKVALLRGCAKRAVLFTSYDDVHVGGSRLLGRGPRITPIQIAWAAGIYEGEGSCGPNATSRARIHAEVVQKDRWILERLRELFGGSIVTHDGERNGKRFEGFAWLATGKRARGFLMTIYSFLSPRRRAQVKTALLRTRRPIATAFHCRRGHPVKDFAAQQKGGRYCRGCKSEKARAKYRGDETYRRSLLERQYAARDARVGPAPSIAPRRPRTHCRRGHELTPENTIINLRRGRQCRACWNEGQRRRYHRRKASRSP